MSPKVTCWTAMVLVVAWGCVPQGEPGFNVSIIPRNILPDGKAFATVELTAAGKAGLPGEGTVSLWVSAGEFVGHGPNVEVPLSAGHGTTRFACNLAVDPRCDGEVIVEASWTDFTVVTTVFAGLNDVNYQPGTLVGGGGGSTSCAGDVDVEITDQLDGNAAFIGKVTVPSTVTLEPNTRVELEVNSQWKQFNLSAKAAASRTISYRVLTAIDSTFRVQITIDQNPGNGMGFKGDLAGYYRGTTSEPIQSREQARLVTVTSACMTNGSFGIGEVP